MAFRRTVKNVVRNFNDIEVKVREATSNDPWGPSSSLMGEIADATYNVSAFSSIMSMLWKRLNDHGKNWRHVYKSLTVLDYIIKTGSERVAQQCRENLFAIQTLKDFQFIDKDGKDQGINVREKSKQIVALLKDEERLKNERQRALKAKERFAQSQGGVGNKNFRQNKKFTSSHSSSSGEFRGSQDDSSIPSQTSWDVGQKDSDSHSTDGRLSMEYEKARPSNEAEEELQLQIALAMSKEEAEQTQQLEVGDEKRLAIALQESGISPKAEPPSSTLLDLTAPSPGPITNTEPFDPWAKPPPQMQTSAASNNPWGSPQPSSVPAVSNPGAATFSNAFQPAPPAADPWATTSTQVSHQNDPWGANPTPAPSDPWKPAVTATPAPAFTDPFAPQTVATESVSNGFDPRASHQIMEPIATNNPFDLTLMDSALTKDDNQTPDFLGNNAKLVNLDDIVGSKDATKAAPINPFASTITPKPTNPFAVEKPKAKSINELRSEQGAFVSGGSNNGVQSSILLPSPLVPDTQTVSNNANPFLL